MQMANEARIARSAAVSSLKLWSMLRQRPPAAHALQALRLLHELLQCGGLARLIADACATAPTSTTTLFQAALAVLLPPLTAVAVQQRALYLLRRDCKQHSAAAQQAAAIETALDALLAQTSAAVSFDQFKQAADAMLSLAVVQGQCCRAGAFAMLLRGYRSRASSLAEAAARAEQGAELHTAQRAQLLSRLAGHYVLSSQQLAALLQQPVTGAGQASTIRWRPQVLQLASSAIQCLDPQQLLRPPLPCCLQPAVLEVLLQQLDGLAKLPAVGGPELRASGTETFPLQFAKRVALR